MKGGKNLDKCLNLTREVKNKKNVVEHEGNGDTSCISALGTIPKAWKSDCGGIEDRSHPDYSTVKMS